MSALAAGQRMIGQPRARREVIDVPERKVEDKSLDKLIVLRKQRLERLERERNEARATWREARNDLREAKERWREALQASKDFWQKARADFFKMTITSGEFRKAKAIYERMKAHAGQLQLEAREAIAPCKMTRTDFFAARTRVVEANLQHEKLGMLRDEIRKMNVQNEF